MKEINVGIIGGCLATTNDIKRSELFYNKIKNHFANTHTIYYSLGSYNDISKVSDEVKRLKEKKAIDYLIFQIRPYVYLKNCRFYLKTPIRNMINPLLFSKNFKMIEQLEATLTKPIHERIVEKMQNRTNSSIKKHLSFYNINLFLGYIFRINILMEEYYINQIKFIKELCIEENIKLIIHGPVTRTSHKMEPVLLDSLTLKLQNNLKDSIYISTNELRYKNNDVLFSDGEHVNVNGHKMLANKLIQVLEANDF